MMRPYLARDSTESHVAPPAFLIVTASDLSVRQGRHFVAQGVVIVRTAELVQKAQFPNLIGGSATDALRYVRTFRAAAA
jgi:hypothetical protein